MGVKMKRFGRIVLMVMDSVGIGALPDAADFGDAGADTIGHTIAACKPNLHNLQALGLGNIRPIEHLPPAAKPQGAYGKAAIFSNGKDTTVGHWEMAGLVTPKPFPTYPDGFPDRIVIPFQKAIGRAVLGNKPASGTEIIKELGEEHILTGRPIIYTSADSVFQIAAHEEVIPLEELYRMCGIARELLDWPDRVGRVIARPFIGKPGAFTRTGNRKDFAIPPPDKTLLDYLKASGLATIGVGKIPSIFDFIGISEHLEAHNNIESVNQTIEALRRAPDGIIFTNLVDFDMLWGHRRDARGYARALEYFDSRIPDIQGAMRIDDCLIITADHGCDPTYQGSDHTREYVPILVYSRSLAGGVSLGTRSSLADMGQTIADNFGLRLLVGASFLSELR
jgi:phosphopentomutase